MCTRRCCRYLRVDERQPVWDGSGAVQAQVGQLQPVEKPFQDVQHRRPLAEYQRVVPLLLHNVLNTLKLLPYSNHGQSGIHNLQRCYIYLIAVAQ